MDYLEKCRIEKIIVVRVGYSLKQPYVLSFKTLNIFVSIQVKIILDNGYHRTAEVVPLFGYNNQTESNIIEYIKLISNDIIGNKLSVARKIIEKDIVSTSFSTSPILTAIDLFSTIQNSTLPDTEFVIPVSVDNVDEMIQAISNANKNSGTVKIKLSGKPEVDAEAIKHLSSSDIYNNVNIRLDVNQGYDLEKAIFFFSELGKLAVQDKISYVEQPMNIDDWCGHEKLQKLFPDIPVMLDESIITVNDIKKAKDIGVKFIKLKLFKQGGIKELIDLSEYAYDNEINVVLGNGVATSLSNELEIKIYHDYRKNIYGAIEANGFKKINAIEFNELIHEAP